MGTPKNPDPRYSENEGHKQGLLKSQVRADQLRDQNTDSIRLRVPAGLRDRIREYVVTLPEYQRTVKGKLEPNVNQWITDLILSQLPSESNSDKM